MVFIPQILWNNVVSVKWVFGYKIQSIYGFVHIGYRHHTGIIYRGMVFCNYYTMWMTDDSDCAYPLLQSCLRNQINNSSIKQKSIVTHKFGKTSIKWWPLYNTEVNESKSLMEGFPLKSWTPKAKHPPVHSISHLWQLFPGITLYILLIGSRSGSHGSEIVLAGFVNPLIIMQLHLMQQR